MKFTGNKYNMANILTLLVFLVVIATGIVWYTQLPENSEFTYTGIVTDIEFLGGAVHPQTLVRFDDGYVLLFRQYEINVPLNEEVIFYYHDNKFGHLFLDRFEVIK